MSFDDILFYVLDAVIFVMLLQWMRNGKKVKILIRPGMQWLIPAIFVAVAVFGWFRYDGLFKYIQTAALLVFAVMYYFMKSGLSDEGIVLNGALTPWDAAGKVTLSKKDHSITYRSKRRDIALYFAPEQMEEVRKFLANRALNTKDQ